MSLRDHNWKPVYESRFLQANTERSETLVTEFYQPALADAIQYDRVVGYLNLKTLANALSGIDSLLETDGEIRLIASKQIDEANKPVLTDPDTPPLSSVEESRLALIAHLMAEDRLEVRIADPAHEQEGIFHAKFGVLTDSAGDQISFEGSINETFGAWYRNYERFKVHRSWIDEEEKYVQEDVATFDDLWDDLHSDVDVYTLPEALEEDLLDWQPEDDEELREHKERVENASGSRPVNEESALKVLSNYEETVGAMHIAEDASPIDPWPHQRVAADTAVSIYPESLLFCDEVGLGKTIEAGLALSRLVNIGKVENALLLVPAAVQRQWQEELREQLNLDVFAYNLDGDHTLQDPTGVTYELSPYDEDSAWTTSHIGEFVSERDSPTIVLASWHLARMTDNKKLFSPSAHAAEANQSSSSEFEWDLALVDEAHHGREGTNLYELIGDLQTDSLAMYLLTATPMQLHVSELYDLLRVCDLPEGWGTRDAFVEYFEIQQDLSETKAQWTHTNTISEAIPALADEWDTDPDEVRRRIDQWLSMVRAFLQQYDPVAERVESVIDERVSGLQETRELQQIVGVHRINMPDWQSRWWDETRPVDHLEIIHDVASETTPVQSRIFRNTRETLRRCKNAGLLENTIPHRDSELRDVELGEAEHLYDRVKSYIDDVYDRSKRVLEGREQTAIGFVMTTYRERLTSSLHAAKQSLERRRENLRQKQLTEIDELDETTFSGGRSQQLQSLSEQAADIDELGTSSTEGQQILQYELSEIESFIHDLEDYPEDPKLEQLIQDLSDLSANQRDQVIIFTQYEDTLDAIKEKLVESQYPDTGTYTGSGGALYDEEEGWVSASKERVKQQFRAGEISYLICTDAASEGLNLQTCDALINYDLAWNPMKVEQRIGRIDRIGQENTVVKILNYAYKDTIEERIFDRAMDRISLFEEAVGPLRPILEGMEEDVEAAAMGESAHTSEEIIDDFESRAETAKQRSEEVGLVQEPGEKETIIQNSRLDGWTKTHPDVGEIGYSDRPFDPLISPSVVNQVFTQSQTLRDQGWEFELVEPQTITDEGIENSQLYHLRIPEGRELSSLPVPHNPKSDTLQARYEEERSVVVTFDPEVLREYPSVVLLLPGNQLFDLLLSEIEEKVRDSQAKVDIHECVGWLDQDSGILIDANPVASSPESPTIKTFYSTSDEDLVPGVDLDNRSTAQEKIEKWLNAYSKKTS